MLQLVSEPGFDPGTCGFPCRKQFTLNKVILIRNFTCLILCGTTVFGFAALYLLKEVQVLDASRVPQDDLTKQILQVQ
ncbi:hypothetical protein P8452_47989 [Trifolium repens]|nr:hypothetical protein P8452_47989 [Trifolium repens]